MTDISDSELVTIQNALLYVREALEADQSAEGTNVKKQIIEAEQIVTAKLDKGKSGMSRDGNMMGGSGSSTTARANAATRALFNWFGITKSRYEPQPTGASAADRMVSDWKMKKNKALFEMFHLT
jgi:hypothetical protein